RRRHIDAGAQQVRHVHVVENARDAGRNAHRPERPPTPTRILPIHDEGTVGYARSDVNARRWKPQPSHEPQPARPAPYYRVNFWNLMRWGMRLSAPRRR